MHSDLTDKPGGPILSVIILTCNEEKNLPHCLKSLENLAVEVFVVDSGSTDNTRLIAEQAGCCVCVHPFVNQSEQLNWAIDNLEIRTPWVMRLDADERITEDLALELKQTLKAASGDITGYMVKRRVYFWGRWIRFGGYYPTWLLRLWRYGKARCEQRRMDEHITLKTGHAGRLRHDIIDENHKGLSFWTSKHNDYAQREMEDLIDKGAASTGAMLAGQAGAKRWLKRNLYQQSPLFLRAFAYWVLRYFILLGFLDGRPGLVFHFLQGFWYRFLVDAKLLEYRLQEKRKNGAVSVRRS